MNKYEAGLAEQQCFDDFGEHTDDVDERADHDDKQDKNAETTRQQQDDEAMRQRDNEVTC